MWLKRSESARRDLATDVLAGYSWIRVLDFVVLTLTGPDSQDNAADLEGEHVSFPSMLTPPRPAVIGTPPGGIESTAGGRA